MAVGDLQGSVEGSWNYADRNLFYGVREHAMGSISNGLATFSGIIPFTATFLVFSDYMRPAIRLAALTGTQVIFVFTHDSIGLGEDGPTHQAVEQLASLRAIPNLVVLRPADANETAIAWQVAIETRDMPSVLVLTRQAVPTLDRKAFASAKGVRRGAYILSEAPEGKPELILMGSGSEVHLLIEAQQKLQKQNIAVRVVSMPSWELFEKQSKKYRDSVFPVEVPLRLAVEAGVGQGWERYVGEHGTMISIEQFGTSAPGEVVMEKYGFSVKNVCRLALKLFKNAKNG
jgi:transketolase